MEGTKGRDNGDNGKSSRGPRVGKRGHSLAEEKLYFSITDTSFSYANLEIMIPTQDVSILHFQIPNQKMGFSKLFLTKQKQ